MEIAGTVANEKQFKEQSQHQFDTKSVDPIQPFGEFCFINQ